MHLSKRLYIRDTFIIFSFSILLFLWFKEVIFFNNIFCYGDLHRYFYPIREFAVSSVKNGDFPLWNPYLRCGVPFFATLQSCAFYPVSFVYYFLPSFDNAFNWYIILHFFFAGLFMYILTRCWKFSRTASVISSFVYVFGGYLPSVINMNTSLSSAIWLPLIFLFFDMTLEKKKLYFAILTAVFLAIQFLGGEPTIIYSTLLLLIAYFIYVSFYSYKDARDIRGSIKSLWLLIIVLMLWAFIAAVQLIPFIELVLNSNRVSPLMFEIASRWSLSLLELVSFFIPFVFGDITGAHLKGLPQDWLHSFYMGIMPIILVFCAIFMKPKRKTIFFIAVLIFSLVLALGKYTPIYRILYKYLFGFGYIRYPVKFIFLSSFAFSYLCGIGYDAILQLKKRKNIEIFTKITLCINGILGFLIVIFLKFWQDIYEFIRSAYILTHKDLFDLYILTVVYLFDSAHIYRLFIIFTSSILLMIMYLKKRIRYSVFGFLSVVLIFLDLSSVNMGISQVLDRDVLRMKPPLLKVIGKKKGYFRIMRTSDLLNINRYYWGLNFPKALKYRDNAFIRNIPVKYRIYDAQGYGSLSLKDYEIFMSFINNLPEPLKSRLIGLLNVKYIIATKPMDERWYKIIYKGKLADRGVKLKEKIYTHLYVYENKNVIDRAFLARDKKVVSRRDEIFPILKSGDFNPVKTVILEEEPTGYIIDKEDLDFKGSKDTVSILSYKPDEVVIKTTSVGPRFLVLSDTYYPGWKVFVDGKPDRLYRADYLFRAVFLDKGEHIVRFIFRPLSYKIGKYISLGTIFILSLYGLYGLLNRRPS